MRFFFWADRENSRLDQIRASSALHGITTEPIGVGQNVRDFHHSLFKQQALFDAIEGLDDREIVCTTDGFDVFFQQDSEYIRNQFHSFGSDVVFSAEKGYSHQYRKFKTYFDRTAGSSPYKYLNAGGVIGYAGALRKLYRPSARLKLKLALLRLFYLRKILVLLTAALRKLSRSRVRNEDSVLYLAWFDYTDQALMGKYLAEGRTDVSIGLDRDCRLFWCSAFEWEDIDEHCCFVDGRLRNKHTGEAPACIHVPWEVRYRSVFLNLYELVYGSNRTDHATDAHSDGGH